MVRRGVVGAQEKPPVGAVTAISPALVKAQAAVRPREVPADVRALFDTPKAYAIGPSDVVSIIVYDHPELLPSAGAVISQSIDPTGISPAPGFIVGADGEVSFPYVGRLKLGGLTEIQASDLITKRIARYVQKPQVTVRIQSFRSRRAYIQGEVRTPGMQIFTDVPMTLPEALNRAGGITPDGDRSAVAVTRGEKTALVDLVALQRIEVNPNRILLKDGDMVTVRHRDESKVYVMGEILRPSALVMRNGRLSLNQALGEAGGVNLISSNPGQIYVIRNNEHTEPVVYHLDAKSPAALALADSFELRSRDVVYVDRVPLVQWNRIISLVLPSAQILNTTSAAARF
jgi:polysaccharide export outer membrane protein